MLDAENKTMQRDMNLIRQLALYIEQAPGPLDSETITIDGYSSEQVGYHCAIIAEAGLVDFENLGKMDLRFMSVMIYRLSWAGHDFLDAARDDTIWNKTTQRIKEKATSMAFDGVLSLLKSAGQSLVGQVSEWVSQ